MSLTDAKLLALATGWRARARTFMHDAQESRNVRDIYRLAGMSASLDVAARELCQTAEMDPNDRPPVANAAADRARLESDIELARGAEKSQP